ncbi:MAG: hypoxanthine phosphoribosyltransferase [SAR324 cluster bacterium]|nr:hypoxanthine phosphoribosyltransferase [SAR324 cluster bacterium]
MSSQLHTFITTEEVQTKVQELAIQISKDYNQTQLHLVGVLKGSFIFLADLARALKIPCSIYFVHASSYGDRQTSSGIVKIQHSLNMSNKHVLIIEDILDTGLTLSSIIKEFDKQQPASLKVCAFLNKPERRQADIEADYTGFTIPNEFVVGYGLDYGELYRNLPYIARLENAEESS